MNKKIIFVIGAIIHIHATHAMSELFFDLRRNQRRIEAHTIKSAVSNFDETTAVPDQQRNGDEQTYSDKRGSFNKALAHQTNGFPNVAAFSSLVTALESEDPADFNKIQMGGDRNLVNPQGSLAFSLAGNDGWINAILPAPTFGSAETAGEMVELYWTAVVRDIPFNAFGTDPDVGSAVADLNTMSNFKGPKVGGVVTRGSFLRGNAPGELDGPYISQFLYLPVPCGTLTIDQTQNQVPNPISMTPGNDFMKTFAKWFTVETGGDTGDSIVFDGTPRFIRTPRDLTEYVHRDFPGQGGFHALLILEGFGADALGDNAYANNQTQDGFVTFGIGERIALLMEAVHEAFKAAWYHKWQVNRRLRPEEFGFYVQQQVAEGMALGIHSDLINSAALTRTFGDNGTYFLSQAYPEGSPTHPSYPAGHATVMGACATILKALYNEDFVIPDPQQPNAGNAALEDYTDSDLTVGGELNKLASNVALGRDHAGVHYRSDGWQGMLLGEQVAIDVLNNAGFLFNENFGGYSFTTFEGSKITVGAKQTP